jgi:hypothetical protein
LVNVAWEIDLVTMTRVLINDLNTPQKNTDAYLQQVLVTAGIIADSEIAFPFDYTYDVTAITITPDPVSSGDVIFQALVPLKAACIIVHGDFRLALTQGIKVRDGDSAIDTSVSFRGYRDILELGPCAAFEKLKSDIQSGRAEGKNAGEIGAAVMSPFREANVEGTVSTISLFFDRFASTLTSIANRNRRI